MEANGLLTKLRRRMLLGLAAGLLVVLALGAYADYRAILGVLRDFEWQVVPLVLLLTLCNYAGRFLKWQYYLGLLHSRVRTGTSLLIFISGFSMVLTPGKVGELLKSYLVKQVSGTPMSRTAPIVLAERLTDGIALLLLGAAGLLIYRRGWEVLVAIFLLAVVLVLVVQSRPLCERLLDGLERLPLGKRLAPALRAAYASSARLLRLDALLPAIGLGLLSWSGECLAFYVILRGLHLGGDALLNLPLLVQAAFILASSTLVGSAALVPGGLGVADGGITGLVQVLLLAPRDVAVAATLLIRFCTLWFGVLLGVIALARFSQRYGQPTLSAEPRTLELETAP